MRTLLPAGLAGSLLCLLPTASMAVGLGQQGFDEETRVTAEVTDGGSLTAQSMAAARARLERIPGGIGFVPAAEFGDDFAQSLGDTLVFTPGIYADTSAQRENRISARGSGLNSSFERRGLTLLRDGVPITRASGSTEFQEVDPLTTDYIEVFKGANSLAYGASALGGAVNIVTPTGVTAADRLKLRLEGGSFETVRANASFAHSEGPYDVFAGVSGLTSDGFRDHTNVDSAYGFVNVGYALSEQIETRFYFTALSDNFKLAGSLSLDDALNDRDAAARPVTLGPFFPGGPVTVLDPGPVADDWDRNLDVIRIANRTVIDGENVRFEGGGWYAFRGLDHAITRFAGIIDQSEDEFGLFARASGDSRIASLPLDWRIGMEANYANNDARTWMNNFGNRGQLRSDSGQTSANILAYAQADVQPTERLSVILGGQAIYAMRDNAAIFNDTAGYVDFSQFNPRFGLLWDVLEDTQAFLNVSRSFEPPSMSDLTAGGAFAFTPLAAQRAWTAEVGTRGQHRYFSWDLSVYRSWVDKELLDFGAPGARGFVSFTANADKTIHQGMELGTDWFVVPNILNPRGLQLTWRHVLTANDFYFDDDTTYGDNDLAGVPDVIYISELKLEHGDDWYVGVNVRWVPDGPYVDFANTTRTPGYDLWGITAGRKLSPVLDVFLAAENVFDKHYVSNVTTNANQQLENAAAFTPGQGAAVFAGITARF